MKREEDAFFAGWMWGRIGAVLSAGLVGGIVLVGALVFWDTRNLILKGEGSAPAYAIYAPIVTRVARTPLRPVVVRYVGFCSGLATETYGHQSEVGPTMLGLEGLFFP
jgi:hypothetical protein